VSEQSAKLSAGFNAKLFIIKILNLSQVNKCDDDRLFWDRI